MQNAVPPMLSGPIRVMDFFARRRDPVKLPASESSVEAGQDSIKVRLLASAESGERTGWALYAILHPAARPRHRPEVVRSTTKSVLSDIYNVFRELLVHLHTR